MLNLFDRRGVLRTDFTYEEQAEIAALDPARRKALDVLIDASDKNQISEAALKTEEANLKQAGLNQYAATREAERVAPKFSHHDNYLAMVKHKLPAPPTPEQVAAKAAVDATTEALAIARDALDSARAAVKDSRASFASALGIWMNDGQPIPTRESLVRDAAKSYKPPQAPRRTMLTAIDEIAAAQSGSAPMKHAEAHGPGFRRQAYPASMRGRLAPGFQKS